MVLDVIVDYEFEFLFWEVIVLVYEFVDFIDDWFVLFCLKFGVEAVSQNGILPYYSQISPLSDKV